MKQRIGLFRPFSIALLFLLVLIVVNCTRQQEARVLGTIDYVGSAEVYLDLPTVHYKYIDPHQIPIQLTESNPGRFAQSIPLDTAQIAYLHIGDQRYPLYLVPGNSLEITVQRNTFPEQVEVDGYNRDWNLAYTKYKSELRDIEEGMDRVRPDFLEGQSDSLISLYQQKMILARKHLRDTPFRPIYFRNVGEYLVKRLEYIKRANAPMDQRASLREGIINEAQSLEFFTAASLKAQRAGIRDFATAYAYTFGVQQSLEKQYDQPLNEYDVRRLGYQTLDSARTSLLQHMESRAAQAHARMYLVAERIGERPLNVADESYQSFINEYADYPDYVAFLNDFYQRRKAVSPGEPAVPFSLPTPDGQTLTMKDFRGKYVLLDFWASWCIPCLDEFASMRDLYQKYDRDTFEIVALSIEEDSSAWRSAFQQFDMPWHHVYGGNGFQQETFSRYQAGGIPFYILVDPEGNILRYNDVRPSFNLDSVLTRHIDRL
jgi:thiol-disulfide isomerase/thioredoxin